MTPEQLSSMMARYPFTPHAKAPNRILTCPVRMKWPQLDVVKPHPKYPDSKPQAGATLIIPPSANLKPLEDMCRAVASQHFGALLDKPVVIRQGGEEVQSTVRKELAWPYRRQTKYAGKPGFTEDGAGYYIKANSLYLPRILDHKRNVVLGTDPAIYAGIWVIALLELSGNPKDMAKARADDAKRGVRATLVQLMKIADDEVLPDGSGDADDAFAEIEVPADMLASGGNAAASALAAGNDVAWA
ncbi:MAG: ssDNA-binding protein [Saprospiraceae bacterium]